MNLKSDIKRSIDFNSGFSQQKNRRSNSLYKQDSLKQEVQRSNYQINNRTKMNSIFDAPQKSQFNLDDYFQHQPISKQIPISKKYNLLADKFQQSSPIRERIIESPKKSQQQSTTLLDVKCDMRRLINYQTNQNSNFFKQKQQQTVSQKNNHDEILLQNVLIKHEILRNEFTQQKQQNDYQLIKKANYQGNYEIPNLIKPSTQEFEKTIQKQETQQKSSYQINVIEESIRSQLVPSMIYQNYEESQNNDILDNNILDKSIQKIHNNNSFLKTSQIKKNDSLNQIQTQQSFLDTKQSQVQTKKTYKRFLLSDDLFQGDIHMHNLPQISAQTRQLAHDENLIYNFEQLLIGIQMRAKLNNSKDFFINLLKIKQIKDQKQKRIYERKLQATGHMSIVLKKILYKKLYDLVFDVFNSQRGKKIHSSLSILNSNQEYQNIKSILEKHNSKSDISQINQQSNRNDISNNMYQSNQLSQLNRNDQSHNNISQSNQLSQLNRNDQSNNNLYQSNQLSQLNRNDLSHSQQLIKQELQYMKQSKQTNNSQDFTLNKQSNINNQTSQINNQTVNENSIFADSQSTPTKSLIHNQTLQQFKQQNQILTKSSMAIIQKYINETPKDGLPVIIENYSKEFKNTGENFYQPKDQMKNINNVDFLNNELEQVKSYDFNTFKKSDVQMSMREPKEIVQASKKNIMNILL